MWIKSRTAITSFCLFLFCQVFFLINIQYPKGHNFDEFHYVPSAKQFLEMRQNQNWEHPPLGKLLMATGIGIFGDQPLGWRFMSTFFGAITLVGIYILSGVVFGNQSLALWIALLTLVNQLLYVQARIGMLDTFMFGFLVWAMVGFCALWKPGIGREEMRRWLTLSGTLFGLSMACKWFAVVPWFACWAAVFLVLLFQHWGVSFSRPKPEDWYHEKLWNGVPWKDWAVYFGILPLFVYALTFMPYYFLPGTEPGILGFFKMQYKMWDGQLRVVNSHPYMSQWLDWPLLGRPIWYAFDREAPENKWVRGVVLLGNPLIMWTGMGAVFYCFWDWITRRRREAFLIFFFYFVFYACWIVIPRKISFYYYYYPAGMMLSLALGYVFQSQEKGLFKSRWVRWAYLGAAFAVFAHFFPILAALRIPADAFRKWMWFRSWI